MLTLHTVTPNQVPEEFAGGVFLDVVGVEQNGQALWLPNADTSHVEPMTFDVPQELAANVSNYFNYHHINNPTKYRNCHIGAVAMSSGDIVGWVDALGEANDIVYTGRKLQVPTLAVGVHGAYGNHEDELGAIHSLVGLTPDLAIQTYNEYKPEKGRPSPLNIASHPHNLAHYQTGNPHFAKNFYANN